MMQDPTTVTREQIIKLSYHNPILYNCLTYWYKGKATFEQALMTCVIILNERNESLLETNLSYLENSNDLPSLRS